MFKKWKGETIRTPETRCLACSKPINMATGISEKDLTPDPGDVTICFHCGYIMAFNEDLTLRELTAEEKEEAMAEERVRIALSDVKKYMN